MAATARPRARAPALTAETPRDRRWRARCPACTAPLHGPGADAVTDLERARIVVLLGAVRLPCPTCGARPRVGDPGVWQELS